jgi:hypothetical protein
MTRHGMVEPSAAGAPPPATDTRAPTAIAEADGGVTSRASDRQHRSKEQRSSLSAFPSARSRSGRAIADTSRKRKSP